MKKLIKLLLFFVTIVNEAYSQTTVTNICTDGTFETSNFDNFSWTPIPYNRIFEPFDNHKYSFGHVFKTNFSLLKSGQNILYDNDFNFQSASSNPDWGKRVLYKSNNVWEITDKNVTQYDANFNPSSGLGYSLPVSYGGNKSIRLGSTQSSYHTDNKYTFKTAFGGYNDYSGNKKIDLSSEAISKLINVSESGYIVNFKYAVVFRQNAFTNPRTRGIELHGFASPFFGVRVIDDANNTSKWLPFGIVKRLNSNTYHTYSATDPLYLVGETIREYSCGFLGLSTCREIHNTGLYYGSSSYDSDGGKMFCSPWRCGQLDLSEFIGKTIRLEFIVGDHYRGFGFGYAYIDDICVNDNFCGNYGDVSINYTKPCGPNAELYGSFTKPKIPGTSTTNPQYQTLTELNVAVYQYGSMRAKVQVPFSKIKTFTSFDKVGSYSVSISDLYDAIPSGTVVTGVWDFDLVAEAKFNTAGSIFSNPQGIEPNNSNNDPNDWSYCCDEANGLKNEKDKFEVGNEKCKMQVLLDRNIISFNPLSKYKYYNDKSELYYALLEANFDVNQPDGFFSWPNSIGHFNFGGVNRGFDCSTENDWYEIKYKHGICNYYSKIRVETTCKVPLSCENVTCQKKDSITLNPYLSNLMGNWRPSETYVYNVKRQDEQKNVRSGEYLMSSYKPAYVYANNTWQLDLTNNNSLIKKDKVLNYDLSGNMVENKNPLNIYSAKKYAYNNTHPHLVASNSTFQESVYYSFESLDHNKGKLEFKIPHNVVSDPFYEKINKANAQVTSETSHTGTLSYKVTQKAGVSSSDTPYVSTLAYFCGSPPDDATPNYNINLNVMQVRANDNTFKPVFDLVPGKEYALTYWVKNIDKEDYGLGYIGRSFDCDKVEKRILFNTASGNIEGWFKVSENFTVPTGAKLLKLVFYPGISGTYFDDIRILPAEANMNSYVYDIKNRMTAELDENNYATFFDYDDQGNLIRVRKETEQGIITVNESRIYLKDQ